VTITVVLASRTAPRDSARYASPWRLCVAILESLLRALALDPVHDLLRRVDRTTIRSLLKRSSRTLQPDATWTINRKRWDPTPFAIDHETVREHRHLGSNDKPLSRTPGVAESPTPWIRAEQDEKRIIDQCDAQRDARRDSGGRRAS
jgi:hypothetical protein